jgi:predicted dehydrogenase
MKKILLIGAGPMAIQYSKILRDLGHQVDVIGRGESSAKIFESETGIKVIRENTDLFIENNVSKYSEVINAVTEEELGRVTKKLIHCGYKKVLVEKPGALDISELHEIEKISKKQSVKIYIGYNRRFYESVLAAKQMIQEDGGVKSFFFDFTERGLRMPAAKKHSDVKKEWFFHNSSHVVDMAFYLGGMPKEMNCFVAGEFDWHPYGAAFSGSGVTESGALFSYHANWACPGRWSLEVMTSKRKFFFKPLEKLSIQTHENFDVKEFQLKDDLDKKYKPGLFLEVKAFLEEDKSSGLPSIQEQLEMCAFYKKILNIQS